jgi:transcriptional regulator with XRE-family HTH domain
MSIYYVLLSLLIFIAKLYISIKMVLEEFVMNRIRKLRTEKGIKQSELANLVNVRQTTISNWENEISEIDKQSLFALSDYFNVTIDYLLGKSDEPTNLPLPQPNQTSVEKKNRIRHLREMHNMKQIDLVNNLNVKQSTLSNWERGTRQPDNDHLIAISEIFGVTTDYLLGVSDILTPPPHPTPDEPVHQEPNLDILQKLAKYFNVTIDDLLNSTDILLGIKEPIKPIIRNPTPNEFLAQQGITNEHIKDSIINIMEMAAKTENRKEFSDDVDKTKMINVQGLS